MITQINYTLIIILLLFNLNFNKNESYKNSCLKINGFIKKEIELEPIIEIWYKTGNKNLIGSFNNSFKDEYRQCLNGWDIDNYPFPKKFDVKLILQNNLIAYEHENIKQLEDYKLNVILKLKISESPNSLYLLNPTFTESILLFNNISIKNKDFDNERINISFLYKDLPFEKYYLKYTINGHFINQFVFQIRLEKSKTKEIYNYEYIFKMANNSCCD